MGDASYTQSSFLGGEVSQFAQGQFDKPWYKTALSKLLNLWPSDDGAVSRRPGFRFLGETNLGKPGRLIAFTFSEETPYNLEITDNLIRMWNNTKLVTTNDNQLVQSISSATPAVFTLANPVTWLSADTIYFTFQSALMAYVGNALLNRQFIVTMTSTSTFTVKDAITGVQIGASDNVAGLLPVVNHVAQLTTSYSEAQNDWHSLRFVQGYDLGVLLHTSVAPRALTVLTTPTDNTFAAFAFGRASFVDGPYLDPFPNAVAYPATATGSVDLTMGYPLWVGTNTIYGAGATVSYNGTDYISLVNNNAGQQPNIAPASWQSLAAGSMINSGAGFASTDVGRMVRLFYNPPIWDPGKTYAAGNNVTYNGEYFTSLVGSNTNNEPDISTSDWVINTSIAFWTWGFITAVNSGNSVTLQLQGAGLLDTTPILVWRLGAWSDTTGWPTCGVYQEGRFWYSGAIPNRIDSSMPNQPFSMAPTGQDGTVADSNGISYTLNAVENNPIFWGIPDHSGIIWGTQEGEFLMSSGTSGAPMTPSNIQAHRETKYGSSNIAPVRTGLTICFVKRYARRVMEYLADVFSNRFFGTDLTQYARHLGARIIEEIDYQEELIPTIWGRCKDGSFIGSTYRRNSLFSTQPPEFNAWHQHKLGSDRLVESLCVGPSVDGTLDAVSIVSNDPSTNIRYVEQMTTLLEETAPITQSWFLDTAITPGAGSADINSLFTNNNWGSGSLDAGMSMRSQSTQGGSMKAIVASGSATNPQTMWIGGYQVVSSNAHSFQVEKIKVTTDTPVLLNTYNSSTFTVASPQDQSWALDPSGRYLAMYLQDSSNPTHYYVIFDTVALSFGTILTVNMGTSSVTKQLAWIDSTHFVIDHVSGGVRGVEVFSVSGTTITNVGFTGVWGAGSSSSRFPPGYAQYVPSPNGVGLINFMTDTSGLSFSAIYGVQISWQSGALVVGAAFTVATGIPAGSGSGPHFNLVKTNSSSNEWTLCYGTVPNYALMSFTVGTTTAAITRPWQIFTTSFGNGTSTFPIYYSETNTILLAQRPAFDTIYRVSTIALQPASFILLVDAAAVGNITAFTNYFYAARLDSQRYLLAGVGGATLDMEQVGIIIDPAEVPSEITFYGLNNLNGKKVSVFAAGMDCGDFIVEKGQVSVPVGTLDAATGWVFNEESFKILQPLVNDFTNIAVTILYANKTYTIPCVIGFNYESQGQGLRPQTPADTGSKNGPGFGKKRRVARYAMQLVNAVSLRIGTNLNKTKPVPLMKVESGGRKLNYLEMYSGIIRDTLDNDYSYDSMLAWKITRPYPCTVTIIGGFIETVDI